VAKVLCTEKRRSTTGGTRPRGRFRTRLVIAVFGREYGGQQTTFVCLAVAARGLIRVLGFRLLRYGIRPYQFSATSDGAKRGSASAGCWIWIPRLGGLGAAIRDLPHEGHRH
jgi:hypothetical protein